MKRYSKIVIFALCIILCISALVACNDKNDDTVKTVTVTLPSLYPDGLESVSANSAIELNSFTLPKGSMATLNVTLVRGYVVGSFKVLVGTKEITPSSSSTENGKVTLNYDFTVDNDVTVSFNGALETHKITVKSEFTKADSGIELVVPYEYSIKATTAKGVKQADGIRTLEEVSKKLNEYAEDGFLYNGTICVTAKIKGEGIAFPHFINNERRALNLEYNTSYSVDTKECTVEALVTITNDATVSFSGNGLIKSSAVNILQEWGRESWIKGEFINEKGTALNTLDGLYNATEIYVSLDKQNMELQTCEALVEAFKYGFDALNVNGKDVKAETKTIDGILYLKLQKPNAYNAKKAEGYFFDDEKLVEYLKKSDKFTSVAPTFTSAIMAWGKDETEKDNFASYFGYESIRGKKSFALCLAPETTKITVVINGKDEITFDNVQTANETTKGIATLYRYYEGSDNFSGICILNNKAQTHKLVLDAKDYGQITSVEVK